MKPTEIKFEERYSDDSGVEFGVKYEENKGNPKVILESQTESIVISYDKIDWFVERLTCIKERIEGT